MTMTEVVKDLKRGDILHIKAGISSLDMGKGMPPWLPGDNEIEDIQKDWEAIVPEGVKVIVSHFGVHTEIIKAWK